MEITYKSIQHYIVAEEQSGNKMQCKFKIENQEFEAESTIEVVQGAGAELVTKMVKSSGVGKIQSVLLGILKKAVLSKNTADTNNDEAEDYQFSKRDKEAAVVAAFETITPELIFVETTDKWRLATEFSEFEKRIKKKPLTQLYDKKIMSRMLVEMARADGKIEEKERLFFDNFLNDETGRLSDLIRASYLTAADCEQVSKEGRPTVFMIVAAVALTDHDFDKEEQEKLARFAKMFGFDSAKQEKILRIAQDYTIEVLLKSKGKKISKEALHELADKIGMERHLAERTQARLRR